MTNQAKKRPEFRHSLILDGYDIPPSAVALFVAECIGMYCERHGLASMPPGVFMEVQTQDSRSNNSPDEESWVYVSITEV